MNRYDPEIQYEPYDPNPYPNMDEQDYGEYLDRNDVFSMLHEILDSIANPYDVEEVKKIMKAEDFEVEE